MAILFGTSNASRIGALAGLGLALIASGRAASQDFVLMPQPDQTTLLNRPSLEQIRQAVIDPAMRELVARLGDDDFKVRDQATSELIERRPDHVQVYALLSRENLTSEQRYRLLTALRDLLVNTPRGALGIRMDPVLVMGPDGLNELKVQDLIEGLPAEKALQVGDRIVEVDHQPLRTYSDLNIRVQSKRPGDQVHLRVRRHRTDAEGNLVRDAQDQPITDELDVTFALGSTELLDRVEAMMRPQPLNLVETARQMEADDACMTFAPPETPIKVKGGAMALAPLGPSGEPLAQDEFDEEVENHPWIRAISQQRRYIDEGVLAESDDLRKSWQMQLTQLYEQYRTQALTPRDAEFLARVIRRFDDLMNR